MASTEGDPVEDEVDGFGRDAATTTPAEVVVAIEDGLRGVLEEDCAIQALLTAFDELKTEKAKNGLSASWLLCE